MPVEPVVESPALGRREWLSVLAKARPEEVAQAWEALDERPDYSALRTPELGLILVRGRMGGGGDPFNLGEMTLTRAAVRLASGETGLAYVAGRERRQAEVAAVFDAMMQSPSLRPKVEKVVTRLAGLQAERRATAARKAAATRVDFFTMVTGRGGA